MRRIAGILHRFHLQHPSDETFKRQECEVDTRSRIAEIVWQYVQELAPRLLTLRGEIFNFLSMSTQSCPLLSSTRDNGRHRQSERVGMCGRQEA
ncbi:MAG: hypothetical protein ACI97A_001983 [Planctomycetota bacterium]|jgi:hypothetical protein